MTTVLFSWSRAGSNIFRTANIGKLTFLLPFPRQEIHEKSTKNEEFQCSVTQVVLVKNSWNKSKYKFNLYFTFKIIHIHNRSCRKLFFLPLLNWHFHYSNLQVFNWPITSQKTVCSHQNLFFLQNKGLNNPICVGRHTKKQYKVVQAWFKDITCVPECHNVNQMTKYEGYPNFDPFRRYFNKSMGEAFYIANYDLPHKATRTTFSTNCNAAQQKSFLESYFSSLVMKQHGNSWKLRWVNSTVLNNKIWLFLIS